MVSPDSTQIAYSWYNKNGTYDLRAIKIDGTEPRVLLANRAQFLSLWLIAWSADGRYILAGLRKSGGTNEMVLIGIGDGSTRVVKAAGKDPCPYGVFSPDGRYIAYGQKGSIILFEVQAGRELPLIQHAASHFVLGWAPDGREILFTSDRSGSLDMWLIAVSDGKPQGSPELVKKDFGGGPLGLTRSGAFFYLVPTMVRDVHIAELEPESGKVISPPTAEIPSGSV